MTMNQHGGEMPGGGPVAPATGPQVPTKQKNMLGLIALIVSVVGFAFACIPGALIVGWVLLPIAFILGITGLFQSGMGKGTSVAAVIVSVIGIVVGVTVFATVVTDSVNDAFGGSGLSASPSASPTETSNDGDSKTAGSRENPLPIGETVGNQDWKVTLGVPREAWSEIAATNQFNDPPPAGMQYWIVPVTATYMGDQTANAGMDVTVKFVGSDNRTYDDRCGVIPAPLNDVGDLYKAGVAEGNTCVTVPAGANGLWTVATGLIGKPLFFAAK
ncbi:hypothetical protein [Mycobacterium sp. SMC-14]|uniref:hypothetical protein n=1 Tax=Mycobacterium sp. SMC-14 TaxID=3385968 RepID=UPI00390C938A